MPVEFDENFTHITWIVVSQTSDWHGVTRHWYMSSDYVQWRIQDLRKGSSKSAKRSEVDFLGMPRPFPVKPRPFDTVLFFPQTVQVNNYVWVN